MALKTRPRRSSRIAGLRRVRFPSLLAAFIVLLLCQVFLVMDVAADLFGMDFHIPWFDQTSTETIAVAAMSITLIILGWILLDHMRQNRRYRQTVQTASGQLVQTLYAKFGEWGLSASESEVALLLIKGLSVAEIARLRDTRPGTIKSQSNAIYRKAGLKSRSELAAYFVEDLLAGDNLLKEHKEQAPD